MAPKSLKNTVLILVALLVLASGMTISQIVSIRYADILRQSAITEALGLARNLALDAADKVLTNDMVALQKILDGQNRSHEAVSYLFVEKDGQILAHTFSKGVPDGLALLNAPVDISTGRVKKIVSEKGVHFMDVAWPIYVGKAGILRLGFSEEPYRAKVAGLWWRVSLLTLVILAAALTLGHFLLLRLLRPLKNFVRQVEAIDEKALESVSVQNPGGFTEVSILASAFGGLLERLKDHTRKLVLAKEDLEAKNRQLDRTSGQLAMSLNINRQIAALPNLKDVCAVLIDRLSEIVSCTNLSILIFSCDSKTLCIYQREGAEPLTEDDCEPLFEALAGMDSPGLLDPGVFVGPLISAPGQAVEKALAFPLKNMEREVFGALLIACPDKCTCVQKEIDIIELVMSQASSVIYRALRHEEEIRELHARVDSLSGYCGILGKDPKMQVIYRLIEDVAPTDASVLIQGESGTGKELVARAIHDLSLRRDRPFVVINCPAYPSTLLESELFGYEKGAFTGAVKRKPGRFELADGGTVFLDEIAEIAPEAQAKLLRVIQTRKFERLGGSDSVEVNIRILAATNRNLIESVKNGAFREDLFFRLNVIPVLMPPLRERRNDIPFLARYFLQQFSQEQGKSITGFSSEAMRRLLKYHWPGNVRELENCVEHSVVLARGEMIGAADLPQMVMEKSVEEAQPGIQNSLVENEARIIRETLVESDWNKTRAADRLGISRSTLYEKMKKHRISKPLLQ
ncbi:MAG: sigma-54-dependent Fis family transcriptional regulator [Deltaproteobacteria bacterium]|nr:sigma-54-dependent Fis family transcriptional regulator [Deltaproteobacteria bacterium]